MSRRAGVSVGVSSCSMKMRSRGPPLSVPCLALNEAQPFLRMTRRGLMPVGTFHLPRLALGSIATPCAARNERAPTLHVVPRRSSLEGGESGPAPFTSLLPHWGSLANETCTGYCDVQYWGDNVGNAARC